MSHSQCLTPPQDPCRMSKLLPGSLPGSLPLPCPNAAWCWGPQQLPGSGGVPGKMRFCSARERPDRKLDVFDHCRSHTTTWCAHSFTLFSWRGLGTAAGVVWPPQSQDLARFAPTCLLNPFSNNSRNTESLLRPPSQHFFFLASECTLEGPGVFPGATRNPKLVWFSNSPSPDARPAWGKSGRNN